MESKDEGKSANSEPIYVMVNDGDDKNGEKMELPVDMDNSLGLNTLIRAFPGAHGLKYRNKVTGTNRALMIDISGSKFLPPVDGWGDSLYTVIYQTTSGQNRGSGDQKTKRKKTMHWTEESDGESDAEGAGGAVVKQKRLESTMTSVVVKNDALPICTDLIVLGLPFATDDHALRRYFEQFGPVVVSEVKVDFKSGKSKGFGFVQFTDYPVQVKVLAQTVHRIDGRSCQVKIPNSKIDHGRQGVNCPKMFVGRVPEKMTKEELRDFFVEQADRIRPGATVLDVFIPRPFRAFAFVTFSDRVVAEEIIRKRDYVINGASLNVSWAEPKDTQMDVPTSMGRQRTVNNNNNNNEDDDGDKNYYYQYNNDRRGYSRAVGETGTLYSTVHPAPLPAPGPLPSWSVVGESHRRSLAPSSTALASGMDALSLNKLNQTISQMDPEVVTAAWDAFWSTLRHNGRGAPSWHQSRVDDTVNSRLQCYPPNRRMN